MPVSLLMVLHALRLECETSMELTASHRSCLSPSCRVSRDKAALSESVPIGAHVKESQRVSTHCLLEEGAVKGLASGTRSRGVPDNATSKLLSSLHFCAYENFFNMSA